MNALLPKRRVIVIIVLVTFTLSYIHCLTINKIKDENIHAKTKVQLTSLNINAFLNDVIRISAPVINEEALYYLHKPNGDAMKLDIKSPKLRDMKLERDVHPIIVRYVNDIKPIITQNDNYDIFAVYSKVPPTDLFGKKAAELESNEFMIGPLCAEDHGNWVLSVYTKDLNGEWVEMFQVISITITEYVPLIPPKSYLNIGDTLNLSIAYPIPSLKTCELVVPRSTFDRFYNRNNIELNNCGFSVPNLTTYDAGTWRIFAVGNIVYEGEARLEINKENVTFT
ncbi:uncharacterized protein LOC111348777 [Spodoptera litura]|uniref:Uncharacterized protein LOC111348777 n=1 Tax=Spodoptera litura TaxID=69820 RepID=A0A9J7III4_SPOLT|nr:uncharacterized protein LOC111348777 [Spodoptera litura]